jgi:methylenetetrahydrofolate dehydrogenase (NADP+)/methenyltetrahydrofolate cyclohydrolase
VVAIGKPGFLTAEYFQENSIVLDVGINKIDSKLTGDVDFENVMHKVKYITPVPGGIGPMTVAFLMANALKASIKAQDCDKVEASKLLNDIYPTLYNI